MGVGRIEYVMVGVFFKKLPFDRWADENERYICGFKDETLAAITLSDMTDEGWVIGRVIVRGDSNVGIELTSFQDNLTPIRFQVGSEIKDKLGINVDIDKIKCYSFTSWI